MGGQDNAHSQSWALGWWSGLALTQPHTYWVTLSKLVNLSEPPVVYLRNGDKEGCLCPAVVGRLHRHTVEGHVLRAGVGEGGAGGPGTHPACNCPPQLGPASGTEKIEACPEPRGLTGRKQLTAPNHQAQQGAWKGWQE